MSDRSPQPAAELEDFAAAQGLRVEERSAAWTLVGALRNFFRYKPLGATGLVLVVAWSTIAVGTVGSGGGWLGLGRYDSQEVFKVASANFADDKIANVLDGRSADISAAELTTLLTDPAVYGDLASQSGVVDDMIIYVRGLIDTGTLLDHLAELDPAQIEVTDGVIYDVDDLLATGTNTPLTTASLQGPSGRSLVRHRPGRARPVRARHRRRASVALHRVLRDADRRRRRDGRGSAERWAWRKRRPQH